MDDYNSRLEEITSLLDKRVDDANTDPTYNHPILSEDENYLPVRKNKSWPSEFGSDSYSWRMIIEPGTIKSSAMINLNVVEASVKIKVKKIFYSSSACMYPERNQENPDNPLCAEDTAYPAEPDSEYGWEKLFSERFYLAAYRNYGIDVRIARFHNIFGPEGSWCDGREKASAAICRKVVEAKDGTSIKIWGDGNQTRSFLYIDECLEGVRRLMESKFINPVNIGSDEMVSINYLAKLTMKIAKKNLTIDHIDGPLGVRGRNSDNKLILKELGWSPNWPLEKGLAITYKWILNKYSEKNN